MSIPFVVAATIAKNRAWVLPRWYDALASQTVRPKSALVLLNDCDDDSESVLRSAWDDRLALGIDTYNTGVAGHDRVEPRYSISNLATLRNRLMEYALEVLPELTHLWLCDSDVIPDDDVLAKLLDADLPVVAAVVRNSPAEGVYNFWCGWRPPYAAGGLGGLKHPYRDGSESSKLLLSEPFVCSLVGACCLIRRDVIDSGVRYGFHEQGEDLFWSLEAQRNGFLLATHPEARTTHFMTKGAEGLR